MLLWFDSFNKPCNLLWSKVLNRWDVCGHSVHIWCCSQWSSVCSGSFCVFRLEGTLVWPSVLISPSWSESETTNRHDVAPDAEKKVFCSEVKWVICPFAGCLIPEDPHWRLDSQVFGGLLQTECCQRLAESCQQACRPSVWFNNRCPEWKFHWEMSDIFFYSAFLNVTEQTCLLPFKSWLVTSVTHDEIMFET